MHQTFYIDIDEEITSIVERLRKSKSADVVIVVPKRALLIQSIINLKLLKKEADELKKNIIIVTQDKFGKLMVEKTGIAVEQRLENVEGEEMPAQDQIRRSVPEPKGDFRIDAKKGKKSRLDTIGSPGFFGSEVSQEQGLSDVQKQEIKRDLTGERLTNTELVADISGSLKKSQKKDPGNQNEGIAPENMIRNLDIKQKSSADFEKDGGGPTGYGGTAKIGAGGAAKIKNSVFRNEKLPERPANQDNFEAEEKSGHRISKIFRKSGADDFGNINLPKKSRKSFAIFASVALGFILLAAAYLFVPKARVTVFSGTKSKSMDMEIKVDAKAGSADLDGKIIPGRTISVDGEIAQDFDATGTQNSSSYKARGTITIYNEYSSASQPLVATTRFLSEDGKLFRLIKGITVPGVTQAGGVSEPGAIEAEVAADEPGDKFNIGPARFTIPGFQNSGGKYEKIYAKSFKSMTGGGEGKDAVKAVSEADIDSAKKESLSRIKTQIKEKIKNEAGEGYLLLDDAISLEEPAYKISNSAGSIADNFNVNLKMSATAIVFKEADLKNVAEDVLGKNTGEGKKIVENSLESEFGKSDADFAGSILNIKVHAAAKTVSILDPEEIKKGILGKNESELEAHLGAYPDVMRVEVNYMPSFISGKIPPYASRVEVLLDNN